MKKLLAFLLVLVTLLSLAACGADETGGTEQTGDANLAYGIPRKFNENPQWDGTLPLVAEGEDNVITIGVQANANVTSFDDNKYTQWLEEQTGLDLQFVQFPGTSKDAATQISLMIAGGEELPDVLYSFSGIKATAKEYILDGYFVDLAPYFKTDAFYTKQAFDLYYGESENKDQMEKFIIDSISDPVNDTVVGFPTVFNNPSDGNMGHIWINQDWLNALGLTAPTNIDELYDVLVAFRDGDPNGNGIKDEIPMMGLADTDLWSIVQYVSNAFVYEYDRLKFTVENGVVSAPYHTDEYRQSLIHIRKLVDDGLLSSMAWTASNSEVKAMINPTGDFTVGIVAAPGDTAFENEHQSMFTYVPLAPLADATGKGGWAPLSPDRSSYATYITADCDNVVLAFRLLDFISSPASYLRQRWGEEGVDWKYVDESNTLPGMLGGEARIEVMNPSTYSEVNNANWHNNSLLASEAYWQYAIDLEDGSWKAQLYKNLQTIVENYNNTKQPAETLAIVNCTEDNEEAYTDANAEITSYFKTARAEFCTGVRNPSDDADWNSYLADLESLGYNDVWIAAAQTSYELSK